MNIRDICTNPKERIPVEFRRTKQGAALFLLKIAEEKISENDIKNPGYFTIKKWLSDSESEIDDYESIVSIEEVGVQKVYDLTVPFGNSFSANGFSVHNCNLPSAISKELVSDVYMRAWKSGCKGFTVYRDGSRSGVLVSTDEKKEEKKVDTISTANAPKRPKELDCDIHRIMVTNQGEAEDWIVFVGKMNNSPYELFAGLSQHIELPKKYDTGTLIKNGKKKGVATYDLVVPTDKDDSFVFKDVVTIFDNPNQGAFTRTISLALRHGIPLQYIVEQIQKDKNSDMFSFSKAISRVLKHYIKDGTKAGVKGCPSCGHEELQYQEGCLLCPSCGYSACG
jgi:ribonucleoside-diphosphate reductase alpha chain